MDLESSFILLIMLLLCAIPILIINRKKRIKERQFLQTLFDLAEKRGCKITDYDKWDHTAIGIDKVARRLFYIRKTSDLEFAKEVVLSQIHKCRFIDTNRMVYSRGISQKITERLELVLTERDYQKPELTLEFYNSIYDSLALRDEIQLAKKWSEIVNSEISSLAGGK